MDHERNEWSIALVVAVCATAAVVWVLLVVMYWVRLRRRKTFLPIVAEASRVFLVGLALSTVSVLYLVPVDRWIENYTQLHGYTAMDAKLLKKLELFVYMMVGSLGFALWREFREKRRVHRRNNQDAISSLE